jgi:hypothetical protein
MATLTPEGFGRPLWATPPRQWRTKSPEASPPAR